jgi:hypothetical protein
MNKDKPPLRLLAQSKRVKIGRVVRGFYRGIVAVDHD